MMIITLCGTTRQDVRTELEREGHVVRSRRFMRRKQIRNGDALLVLNVGGNVSGKMRAEVEYAIRQAKAVYWLETDITCELGRPPRDAASLRRRS